MSANPTFATNLVTSIPSPLHEVCTDPRWSDWAAALPPLATLASRRTGVVVTDHRTSFVRTHDSARGTVYAKTYEYQTWGSRLRDFGRRTGPCATPRAVREFAALRWLRAQGFDAPTPLLAAVSRSAGFVTRALLVTAAWLGEPAAALLPTLDAPDRRSLREAIEALLHALHAQGFRDGNFDLRNLLAARTASGWRIAKIDSPRFRLVKPGPPRDALAAADWRRVTPQLDAWTSSR